MRRVQRVLELAMEAELDTEGAEGAGLGSDGSGA
jgi:hypothetical protein